MYKWLLGALLLSIAATGSKVKVVNLQQLNSVAKLKNNDTLYVVNFWATWCNPCVKEMPFFEKANTKFAVNKVKVIFVSLNSAKELSTVEQFVQNKQVKSDVVLLNAGNPNNWIDSIEPQWSGTIPATIMYKKGKEVFFHETELSQTQLDSIIQLKLK